MGTTPNMSPNLRHDPLSEMNVETKSVHPPVLRAVHFLHLTVRSIQFMYMYLDSQSLRNRHMHIMWEFPLE